MDFFSVVRGDGPVSVQEGLEAIGVLAPIISAAPDNEEAVKAAEQTIARMPRESLAATLMDWWFTTTTGSAPPLGLAFHLPEIVPVPLRTAMDSVTALSHSGLTLPPAQWVRKAHELTQLLTGLDDALLLDSYGNSKLPGEREVWAWLLTQLEATIAALRGSRRAHRFELNRREYEKQMKAADIDENSRRWQEMLKRAQQCVSSVNDAVDVQADVEPWKPHQIPEPIGSLPTEVTEIGPIADTLLAPLMGPAPRAGQDDAASLAHVIDGISDGRSTSELSWLASVCDGWIDATGCTVNGLSGVLTRRGGLWSRITAACEAGVDTDDMEILFLEHELDEVEAHLNANEAERKAQRHAQAITGSLDQLERSAQNDQMPEEWNDLLASARSLVLSGELDEAERLRQRLDSELRASRRSEMVEELNSVADELEALRAPSSLLLELEGHLRELADLPQRQPDTTLLQRNRERLDSIRRQRLDEGRRLADEAQALLESEQDLIPAESVPLLELGLAQAEQLLDNGGITRALDVLNDLINEINGQRVHRWVADDGEGELIEHVINYCTQEVHFDPEDVKRLYVAAKTKPFAILAGLTGSGKSTIARMFAAALGADAHNGRFQRIAVRPDWIDQSEVLGTVNPLSNRFEPGWLATTARQCEQNPDQLHVVLLDEMNLAPVEQYLAEYLSALEEARSGSELTVLPLYSSGMTPDNAEDWPPAVPFPLNLLVIGTVNVDETTRVLSDRVLDRANVLQLSVAVSDAHHHPRTKSVRPWYVPFPEWDKVCLLRPDDGHHEFLVDVADLLQGIGIGVGQRAHVELERFVTNANGVLSAESALDLGVLQRIVPKIRGFKRDLLDGLTELHDLLLAADCQRSAAVVATWLESRVSDDEFLDGTDARIGLVR